MMISRPFVAGLGAVALFSGLFSNLAGCTPPPSTPKLTVVMVVDMFPAEVLDRFGPYFSDNGFKRLIGEGAHFTDAHFSFGTTQTGPGHATIATGTTPLRHGIVANEWYAQGQLDPVGCVQDPGSIMLGINDPNVSIGFSTQYLEAPTLGDSMKEHLGDGSRVWACSLKDRAAVLSAGHKGDGAIFWLTSTGDFVSSAQYFRQFPEYIMELNDTRYSDSFFQKDWDRILPASAYASVCDDDNADYEQGQNLYWRNTLPKTVGRGVPTPNRLYWPQLRSSPFGNEMVFELARRIVINENLGADDSPDLLTVSLSSTDAVGHIYGTRSHEYFDTLIRADRMMAEWLDFLDQRVGLKNCTIVLTGDHGVCPPPEWSKAHGLGGERFLLGDIFGAVNDAMTKEFGPATDNRYYLMAVSTPWITLNESPLLDAGIKIPEAARVAAKAARDFAGIADAFSIDALRHAPREKLSKLEQAVLNSSFENRSGHVYMHIEPNHYRRTPCAGHGSAHAYDTHVPLVFYGSHFKKGQYAKRVNLRDVAPTLSATLGIAAPAKADGRPLIEALLVKPKK